MLKSVIIASLLLFCQVFATTPNHGDPCDEVECTLGKKDVMFIILQNYCTVVVTLFIVVSLLALLIGRYMKDVIIVVIWKIEAPDALKVKQDVIMIKENILNQNTAVNKVCTLTLHYLFF